MPCLPRLVRLAAAALVTVAAVPAAAHAGDGDIVVRRAAGLSAAERNDVRRLAGVRLQRTLPVGHVEVVAAPAGGRAAALRRLRRDPDVVWAEPDRRVHADTADTYFGQQWGLQNTGQVVYDTAGTPDADIDAPEAWSETTGQGATVAVVDTGAVLGHPDLSLVPGHDYLDGDDDPADGNGHGTHVAGIIAARENGAGTVGVAPAAAVMPLKALKDDGTGWSSDIAAAFAAAGDAGLRVVNASLGGGYSQAEADAIATHPGTLYVVAAGNAASDDDTDPEYPCAFALPNVLCVGASRSGRPPCGVLELRGAHRRPLRARNADRVDLPPDESVVRVRVPRRHLHGHPLRRRRGRAAGGALPGLDRAAGQAGDPGRH